MTDMQDSTEYQIGYLTKAVTDLTTTLDRGLHDLHGEIGALKEDVAGVKSQISMARTAIWAVKITFTSIIAFIMFFLGPLDTIYKWLKTYFSTGG